MNTQIYQSHFFKQVLNIKIQIGLIFCLIDHLTILPVRYPIKRHLKPIISLKFDVPKKWKIFESNFLSWFIIVERSLSHKQLITKFIIAEHKESKKRQNQSEQTPSICDNIINFAYSPRKLNLICRQSQSNPPIQIIATRLHLNTFANKRTANLSNIIPFYRLHIGNNWPDTRISLYFISTKIYKEIFPADAVIAVVKIERDVLLKWVDFFRIYRSVLHIDWEEIRLILV